MRKAGFYAKFCNMECTSSCVGGCHQITAHCASCTNGTTDNLCNLTCGNGCEDLGCDINGNCQNCKTGYSGSKCSRNCSFCLHGACR